jgi:hypothetical protein
VLEQALPRLRQTAEWVVQLAALDVEGVVSRLGDPRYERRFRDRSLFCLGWGWAGAEILWQDGSVVRMTFDRRHDIPSLPASAEHFDVWATVVANTGLAPVGRLVEVPFLVSPCRPAAALLCSTGFSLSVEDHGSVAGWRPDYVAGAVQPARDDFRLSAARGLLEAGAFAADKAAVERLCSHNWHRNDELRHASLAALRNVARRGHPFSSRTTEFFRTVEEHPEFVFDVELIREAGVVIAPSRAAAPPEFRLGDAVVTDLRYGGTPRTGTVWWREWHHRDRRYIYLIRAQQRVVRRQYRAAELTAIA